MDVNRIAGHLIFKNFKPKYISYRNVKVILLRNGCFTTSPEQIATWNLYDTVGLYNKNTLICNITQAQAKAAWLFMQAML